MRNESLKREMTKADFFRLLRADGICGAGMQYAQMHGGDPGEMLRDCQLALYILRALRALRRHVPAPLVVRLTIGFARVLLPYATGGDGSPRKAIESAEAWLRGKVGPQACWNAARAAVNWTRGAHILSNLQVSAGLAAYHAALAAMVASYPEREGVDTFLFETAETTLCLVLGTGEGQIPGAGIQETRVTNKALCDLMRRTLAETATDGKILGLFTPAKANQGQTTSAANPIDALRRLRKR